MFFTNQTDGSLFLSKQVMWPRTSRAAKRKCEKSFMILWQYSSKSTRPKNHLRRVIYVFKLRLFRCTSLVWTRLLTTTVENHHDWKTEWRRPSLKYLEQHVGGDGEVDSTAVFADANVCTDLLLHLLRSRRFEARRHRGANNDGEKLPSLSVGGSHSVGARFHGDALLGGHSAGMSQQGTHWKWKEEKDSNSFSGF